MVRRSYLGVGLQPVKSDGGPGQAQRGVMVNQVVPGSPASAAGLKRGDVIVRFGNRALIRPHDLQSVVAGSPIGSRQTLDVLRDGQRRSIEVTLKQKPANVARAAPTVVR